MTRTLGIAVLAAAACLWSAAASAQVDREPGHGPVLDDPFAKPGLQPEDPGARAANQKRIGAASACKQDWAASRKAYERALRFEPQDIDAHVGLAVALQALNDPGLQQQSQWLRSRAQACRDTCPDAARLKTLERAGFFSASS